MQILVITRGDRFPLERLQDVLKRPKCGERKMRVLFDHPQTRKGPPMSEDEAEYISENFGIALAEALKIAQRKKEKRVSR